MPININVSTETGVKAASRVNLWVEDADGNPVTGKHRSFENHFLNRALPYLIYSGNENIFTAKLDEKGSVSSNTEDLFSTLMVSTNAGVVTPSDTSLGNTQYSTTQNSRRIVKINEPNLFELEYIYHFNIGAINTTIRKIGRSGERGLMTAAVLPEPVAVTSSERLVVRYNITLDYRNYNKVTELTDVVIGAQTVGITITPDFNRYSYYPDNKLVYYSSRLKGAQYANSHVYYNDGDAEAVMMGGWVGYTQPILVNDSILITANEGISQKEKDVYIDPLDSDLHRVAEFKFYIKGSALPSGVNKISLMPSVYWDNVTPIQLTSSNYPMFHVNFSQPITVPVDEVIVIHLKYKTKLT